MSTTTLGQNQSSRTLRTRWTGSHGLLPPPGGRTGALSVSLRAACRARSRPLNSVEAWAVLCQAAQALQDRLLQLPRLTPKALPLLLCSPDTLRLTQDGRVELSRVTQADVHILLHPGAGSTGRPSPSTVEQAAVWALGRSVRSVAPTISSLKPLIGSMTTDSLCQVTGLVMVLAEVERYWRHEIGLSPASQIVAQLCHLALGRGPPAGLNSNLLPYFLCWVNLR